MTIKKIGHCCLVIEMKGVRFLTDPGSYSTGQNDERDIDCVVITHEHADHFHLDSLKAVLRNNPNAGVVTNAAVGKLLDQAGIPYVSVPDGGRTDVGGISLTGHGAKHAVIYKEYGQVENTGYFFDGTLFYPGDAFFEPGAPVDVLALPVAGPWCKLSEVIEYALALKPRAVFPVHDAVLSSPAFINRLAETFLQPAGIAFMALELGKETEIGA